MITQETGLALMDSSVQVYEQRALALAESRGYGKGLVPYIQNFLERGLSDSQLLQIVDIADQMEGTSRGRGHRLSHYLRAVEKHFIDDAVSASGNFRGFNEFLEGLNEAVGLREETRGSLSMLGYDDAFFLSKSVGPDRARDLFRDLDVDESELWNHRAYRLRRAREIVEDAEKIGSTPETLIRFILGAVPDEYFENTREEQSEEEW